MWQKRGCFLSDSFGYKFLSVFFFEREEEVHGTENAIFNEELFEEYFALQGEEV